MLMCIGFSFFFSRYTQHRRYTYRKKTKSQCTLTLDPANMSFSNCINFHKKEVLIWPLQGFSGNSNKNTFDTSTSLGIMRRAVAGPRRIGFGARFAVKPNVLVTRRGGGAVGSSVDSAGDSTVAL